MKNVVEILNDSILAADVDVIVNPANSFMNHGGGLAAAIHGCATGRSDNGYFREDWPDPFDTTAYFTATNEYTDFHPGLIPTGGAVLGPAGALCRRFKGIIHAVGPIWGGGDYFERALLREAYNNALTIAEREGFDSIAFPAISAGIFGCPIEVVADAAAMMCCYTSVPKVTFALMDQEHIKAFETAIAWHTR